MLSEPLAANKNILGYTLKERIGSGGFGEVWSAVAPGGILKAVKVVYGFHDEKRAQAELKALDRVKELRHPFLLSLERIEIYESQLVVVTELADNSLADVYNQYAAKGEPGIPRDELVKHIRSAADALDYMSDRHGLQHLDIKPENLLMVSGHVKVADFGLIKDLQDASQSLMSGMTPAYAAPELFDGRPGRHSDQYSLAIVYQEMLTGVRPFPGQTPAQLAAQHMHGKPNLRPLPQSDQPVLAKALSKDPEVRYKSCLDMAEELGNKKRKVRKAIRRTAETPDGDKTPTISLGNESRTTNATALISGSGLPFQHAAQLKALEPPQCDAENAKLQPLLIVGVGETANKIVAKLKSSLSLRHGPTEEAPAISMLCIDSDRDSINRFRMSREEGALLSDELLDVPLRKAEEYRDNSRQHLEWLNRRWIYNVPRSLQTEGLRPLGRLAFADHFETICDRLQNSIKEISTLENLAKTADFLDMDPGEISPRVFVVTSISGGLGSGMTLDLAYTIKLLLHEAGMQTDQIVGLLMHSTYQRSRDPGLSAANAFAFLTEMRHFVENGFPGDNSIGLPELEEGAPFDFTYFQDMGNDLSQSDYDAELDKVAEYIYLSATSRCSEFFDACRAMEAEIDHLTLRTFGLSVSNKTASAKLTNEVGLGLARLWTQGDPGIEFDAHAKTQELFDALELTQDQAISLIKSSALSALDGSLEAIFDGAHDIAIGPAHERRENLQAYLDGAFGCPDSRPDSEDADPELCLAIRDAAGSLGLQTGDQLSTAILALIDGSELKLHDAKLTSEISLYQIQALREQLTRALGQCEESTQEQLLKIQSFDGETQEPDFLDTTLAEYCNSRLTELVMRFVKVYYRVISQALESVQNMVGRYESQIRVIENEFKADLEFDDPSDEPSVDSLLNGSIADELDQHVSQTELQIYESIASDYGGFLEMLNTPSLWTERLAKEIRDSIQKVLSNAFKKVSLESVIVQNNIGPEQLIRWLGEKINDAKPRLDSCGGNSRLLIGLPLFSNESMIPEMLEKQFQLKGSDLKGTSGNFVFCFEAEEVSFANVAFRLLEARPDAIELAKRIQTRKDISWTTLDDLL